MKLALFKLLSYFFMPPTHPLCYNRPKFDTHPPEALKSKVHTKSSRVMKSTPTITTTIVTPKITPTDTPTDINAESVPSSPASVATIVSDEAVVPRRRKNPHPMRSPDKVKDNGAVYGKCIIYEIYESNPLALLDRKEEINKNLTTIPTSVTTRSAKRKVRVGRKKEHKKV
ncbi:5935_t:CDS:2 [Paraglomus brasilianum]|uniref:5935_t:CDS:1 n=1 Tax=Paraglomus brasilianum TaxID=144538 RepID=A0A9N8WJS2_9GLOM|nr:5935_t:CDS:2 [Paraglomus brasilianum]